jgi:hypothetical protein
MRCVRSGVGLLGVLLVCAPAIAAAKNDRYREADELAGRVDRLIDDGWKKANVTPARTAADGEWLRRLYLDLAGRIPSVAETRSFLKDDRPDKRKRLVESLLAGPRYPTFFAAVWRSLLLPEANTNIQIRIQAPAFEGWLRNELASERGYDALVRNLLAAAVAPGRGRVAGGSAPNVFFAAKENKPEELAGTAASVFLGVNIGCAQCHNHPFASWKRDQFWSFAAFFGRAPNPRGRGRDATRGREPGRNELRIPGTDKVVKAKHLDGKAPRFEQGATGRRVLVDWMTAEENPYFARAAVNRLWAHFFGTALLEPLDAMVGSADAVESHPGVLDELAKGFTKRRYDLRWLIRAVTGTKAYQLSSARSHPSQDDPKQFARMALRGLSGGQLFDSIAQATGFRENTPAGRARFNLGGPRNEFLTKFAATSEKATEHQTSILQALTLMNGRLTTAATSPRQSETLAAVIDAPFMDVGEKIETLYLASLSRKPTAKELARLKRYVEKEDRPAEALADVFWALLNSAEFSVNH